MQAPPIPPYQTAPQPPQKKNTVLWIVLGVVGLGCCGFFVVGAAILFPVFAQTREAALMTRCQSNVKSLSLGLIMYSADYDDRMPPTSKWMDVSSPYIKEESSLHCPKLGKEGGYGYALNEALAGKNTAKIMNPEKELLVFETTNTQKNAASGSETIPDPGRHRKGGEGRSIVGYLDGSTRFLP